MSRRKLPLTTIGSAVHAVPPATPAATSVQPSAIERAGDALGLFLWKSVPVVKAVALGTAAAVVEAGHDAQRSGKGAPWMDMGHPDYVEWAKFLGKR